MRVHQADVDQHPECVTRVMRPWPWSEVTEDASGRTRALLRDGLGRLVEVREGGILPSPGEPCRGPGAVEVPDQVTARYRWDGTGRLQVVEDGDGNTWWYARDLAGRQRGVQRAGPGEAPRAYLAFDFDGGLPEAMYEGVDASPAVTWSWDELGRLTEKAVRRPTGGYDRYTWAWDTRWLGAKTRATSPAETTEWRYQAEPDGVGQLGRVTRATRWFEDLDAPVSIAHAYDLAGHDVETSFPSGVTRTSTWRGERLVGQSVHDPLGEVAVSSTWDSQGRASGWTSSAWSQATRWSGPAEPGGYVWSSGKRSYGVTYEHGADGRLTRKVLEGGAYDELVEQLFPAVSIDYDGLGRVARLRWGEGPPAESFTYDVVGNPRSMSRVDPWGQWSERWAYEPTPALREPGWRVSPGEAWEALVRDPETGRVTARVSYPYQGGAELEVGS